MSLRRVVGKHVYVFQPVKIIFSLTIKKSYDILDAEKLEGIIKVENFAALHDTKPLLNGFSPT